MSSANHLRRRGNKMAHWMYILWAVNALVGLATWRNVPLAVVRLVGALTKDPERAAQCAEILRLARKDAKDLPGYLKGSTEHVRPTLGKRPTRKRAVQDNSQSEGISMNRVARRQDVRAR